MDKAEALEQEIDSILEALRISLATYLEALNRRTDALADLSLTDKNALKAAMRAVAATHIYCTMQSKVEKVLKNPEQVEAILDEIGRHEE